MILWLVMDVCEEKAVALLCTPLEEFVALDFMVNVRPNAARPSSYADFLFLMEDLRPAIADVGLEWNGEFLGGGAGGGPSPGS